MAPSKSKIVSKKAASKASDKEIVDDLEVEETVMVEPKKQKKAATAARDVDSEVESDTAEDASDADESHSDEEEDEAPKAKKPAKSSSRSKSKDMDEDDDDASSDSEGSSKRQVNSAISKVMLEAVHEALDGSFTKKDIKLICDTFVKQLVSHVMEGEKITLTNHMTFKRALRAEREHVTPNTGKRVTKPAHYVIAMEVKPSLKERFANIKITKDDEEAMDKKKAVASVVAPPKKAAPKKTASK